MGFGVADEALHGVDPPRIGHRTHLHALVQAVAHRQVLEHLREIFDEAAVNRFMDVETRRRNTHLPGVAVLAGGGNLRHFADVHVIEDHHRRVPAELQGDLLDAVGGQAHELLADRNRAGESDLSDDRRCNQVL